MQSAKLREAPPPVGLVESANATILQTLRQWCAAHQSTPTTIPPEIPALIAALDATARYTCLPAEERARLLNFDGLQAAWLRIEALGGTFPMPNCVSPEA